MSNTRESFDWTHDACRLAIDLWHAGLSASEVARRLGGKVSRNAVIGKLHRLGEAERGIASTPKVQRRHPSGAAGRAKRLGLPHKPRKMAAPKSVKPPKSAPAFRFGPGASDIEQAPSQPPELAFAPLPGETNRPWTERTFGQCAWPLDVGDEVHSCCKPIAAGSYCATHRALGFRPQPPREVNTFVRSLRRYA